MRVWESIEREFCAATKTPKAFSRHARYSETDRQAFSGTPRRAVRTPTKRIFIVAAHPLSSLCITLALSTAKTDHRGPRRGRWLINDRSLHKTTIVSPEYILASSPRPPPQFYGRVLPRAPLVTNSSYALTSNRSLPPPPLLSRFNSPFVHCASVYNSRLIPLSAFLHPVSPVRDVSRSAWQIVLAIKVAYVFRDRALSGSGRNYSGVKNLPSRPSGVDRHGAFEPNDAHCSQCNGTANGLPRGCRRRAWRRGVYRLINSFLIILDN